MEKGPVQIVYVWSALKTVMHPDWRKVKDLQGDR